MAGGAQLIPWAESWRPYFRLAGGDWTPPKQIRMRTTRRGLILRAAFVTPDGAIARCAVMMRRGADQKFHVADEGVTIKFRLAPKAAQP